MTAAMKKMTALSSLFASYSSDMLVHSDYGAEDLATWLIAVISSTAAAAVVTVLTAHVIVELLVYSNAVIVAFNVYAAAQ